MGNVIVPCLTNMLRRVKSPRIVSDFLATGEVKGRVDTGQTGRTFDQVYAALHVYLKQHPELQVELAREDGDIFLYRSDVGTDRTLHPE